MNDIFTLKQEFLEIAEITVAVMMKQLQPSFDELGYEEACEFAGTRWLRDHIKAGHIKKFRKGTAKNSKCVYSRSEILALKKAEKEFKAQIIFK